MSFVCIDLLEECHLQQPGARITWQSCSFPRRSWHQVGRHHGPRRISCVLDEPTLWVDWHLQAATQGSMMSSASPSGTQSVTFPCFRNCLPHWKCHALGKAIEGSHPIWGLRFNWPLLRAWLWKPWRRRAWSRKKRTPPDHGKTRKRICKDWRFKIQRAWRIFRKVWVRWCLFDIPWFLLGMMKSRDRW